MFIAGTRFADYSKRYTSVEGEKCECNPAMQGAMKNYSEEIIYKVTDTVTWDSKE